MPAVSLNKLLLTEITLPVDSLLSVGVKVAVKVTLPSADDKLLSTPFPAIISPSAKPVTASEKVKVTMVV